MNYETAAEIEIQVASWFDTRLNLVVPNVTWGLNFNFEFDLAIATKAGYLYEVEIKVTHSDLIKDKSKDKWRYYDHLFRIRKLWFAVPEKLRHCEDDIPARAGLLVVHPNGLVRKFREAKADASARKLSDAELHHLAHLGAMRIWDLKRKILQLEKRNRDLMDARV